MLAITSAFTAFPIFTVPPVPAMTEAVLHLRQTGPLCSVQDGGRPGLARFGVPASGAMDRVGLVLANAALGNPLGAAVVEVSVSGLQLDLAEGSLTVAVAGGGFIVETGAAKHGSWTVLTLHAGQTLTIRPGPWGSWTYLAFAGTLVAPSWLGAQATHAASGLGGGILAAGDVLTITKAETRPTREGTIPCPIWARPGAGLQVVLGPQDRFFAPETLELFLDRPFRMTPAYDRMGIRLEGPKLPPLAALAIPSEPLLRGAVQVSGDGAATVLMADHQTTGGYPKIATLLGPETDRLAQARPGATFRFRAVSPEAALHLTRQRAAALRACISRLTP
jgi:allophanate hydrolase